MMHPSPLLHMSAPFEGRMVQLRAPGTVAVSGSEGDALDARDEGGDLYA